VWYELLSISKKKVVQIFVFVFCNANLQSTPPGAISKVVTELACRGEVIFSNKSRRSEELCISL
jgi:hypothetical protein